MEIEELAERYRSFAEHSAGDYAPTYRSVVAAIADDPQLLSIVAEAGPGAGHPGLLLGSVRFLDGEVIFAVGLLVVGILLYRGTFDDRPTSAGDEAPGLAVSAVDSDVRRAGLVSESATRAAASAASRAAARAWSPRCMPIASTNP